MPDATLRQAAENDPTPLTRAQVLARHARSGYALDTHPGHVIRRAHQRATLRFQQVMAGEDLSPTQFAALATLLKHGEVSQNHLGRLTAMDPSTISVVMRKLLKHGLIRRSASAADQRLTLITLSDKGVRYTLDRLERSVEVGRRILEPLSPDEQATFMTLLGRIGGDAAPERASGEDPEKADRS